jgi:hypothetical protein
MDENGIKLLEVVLPTRMSNPVVNSRDLLRAPVVDGQDITIDSCKLKAGKSWHYMLRDTSKPDQPAIKVYRAFFNTVSLPTKADATLAGEKLCRYLERLPARIIVRLSCRRKVFSVVTHARGNSGWFLYKRVMVSAHPVSGQSTRSRRTVFDTYDSISTSPQPRIRRRAAVVDRSGMRSYQPPSQFTQYQVQREVPNLISPQSDFSMGSWLNCAHIS